MVQQSPPPPEIIGDTQDEITVAELDPSLARSTNLLVEGNFIQANN
jgi:hypothetical protein